mmetsp:Transcript_8644/g.26781  ORF Transcript_8644/g.26781 Transcript_8644/m.26781 type:complete len:232 (-) Transcript_8644:309-1004(-)
MRWGTSTSLSAAAAHASTAARTTPSAPRRADTPALAPAMSMARECAVAIAATPCACGAAAARAATASRRFCSTRARHAVHSSSGKSLCLPPSPATPLRASLWQRAHAPGRGSQKGRRPMSSLARMTSSPALAVSTELACGAAPLPTPVKHATSASSASTSARASASWWLEARRRAKPTISIALANAPCLSASTYMSPASPLSWSECSLRMARRTPRAIAMGPKTPTAGCIW